jgi:hypothetical protein
MNSLRLFLAASLLCSASLAPAVTRAADAAASPKKHYDVSTGAGIAKAMKELEGWNLKDDENCIKREGDTVVLVASFANDFGCMAAGYFADGYYYKTRQESAPALKTLGWADQTRREAIALRWANAMTSPEGLSGEGKDAPQSKLQKDGSVVVEGWNAQPVGMVPQRTSHQLRITFSDAGDSKTETLKTVTTKLH